MIAAPVKWGGAIGGSLAIHLAIAAVFLVPADKAEIAGGIPKDVAIVDDMFSTTGSLPASASQAEPVEPAAAETEPTTSRTVQADATETVPATAAATPPLSEAVSRDPIASAAAAPDAPADVTIASPQSRVEPETPASEAPTTAPRDATTDTPIEPEPQSLDIANIPVPVARPAVEPQPRKSKPRNRPAAARAERQRAQPGNQPTEQNAGRSAERGTASKAGNAAVSNYPGRIVARLRRALRYPAEARRDRVRGVAHVRFTVTASGTVNGARVVRSSGSGLLDQAALETIRRAAPFPAIPPSASRSSWSFTVPLAYRP